MHLVVLSLQVLTCMHCVAGTVNTQGFVWKFLCTIYKFSLIHSRKSKNNINIADIFCFIHWSKQVFTTSIGTQSSVWGIWGTFCLVGLDVAKQKQLYTSTLCRVQFSSAASLFIFVTAAWASNLSWRQLQTSPCHIQNSSLLNDVLSTLTGTFLYCTVKNKLC